MKEDLKDFPDDVRELLEPLMGDETPSTLDAISLAIAARLADAKEARTALGIETIWKECEEAYIGIDDANRQEFQNAKWSKPTSMDGPVTTGVVPAQAEHKSTAFVRLTARYVDAGAAKLSEILLPADDKAFSFSEMPVPDAIKARDDTRHVIDPNLGPLYRPAKPGEAAMPPGTPAVPPVGPVQPAQQAAPLPAAAAPVAAPAVAGAAAGVPGTAAPPPPQVPLTAKDVAEEQIEIEHKKAKAAEDRVYDWMVASNYGAEARKVIFDCARIGTGVIKGPFPKSKRGIVVTKGSGGFEIVIADKIAPAVSWVDPWNIFPDPACGENVHDGDFIFERDYLSPRQVRDLKKLPGYIAKQIDKVLDEGPEKGADKDADTGAGGKPGASKQKGRFEIWYYFGSLKRDELCAVWQAAERTKQEIDEEIPSSQKEIYVIATMINDCVIRATINPLDSGSFPYHSMPWQRRAGNWAGIGVAEQLKMPQRTVNAATRAMLNNAGKSAGSQIIVDKSCIVPADSRWSVTPDKIWHTTSDGQGKDVRTMFLAVEIPNVTPQLMTIIEYGLKLAEESTSIPLITQGQTGPTTPETLGATQLQDSNANQLLRAIGYAFDDYITEPLVRQFYEWLLLDPDVPDDEKGEFEISAHGSASLVERAIQDQTVAQMGQMSENPIYGIDPKRWAKQWIKTKHLDPKDFQYSEEEQRRLDASPPVPVPVQVAEIKSKDLATQIAAKQSTDQQSVASEERIAQAASVIDGQRVQTEAERVQAEDRRTLVQQTIKLHELQTQRDLAILEYANRHQISVVQAKADLAKTAMTLDTQRQLNAADNAADAQKEQQRQRGRNRSRGAHPQRSAPPLVQVVDQVPGRAGNGRAFEQGPQQ